MVITYDHACWWIRYVTKQNNAIIIDFLHAKQWIPRDSDSIINEWQPTWRRWEDARNPLRNVLRTIVQNDVTIGDCVTSQPTDRPYTTRMQWSINRSFHRLFVSSYRKECKKYNDICVNECVVIRGVIRQWLSLVTASPMKMIGESPHSRPTHRYPWQPIYHSTFNYFVTVATLRNNEHNAIGAKHKVAWNKKFDCREYWTVCNCKHTLGDTHQLVLISSYIHIFA